METKTDDIQESAEPPRVKTPGKKHGCWLRFAILALASLLILAAVIWLTLSSAKDVPEFYATALQTDMARAKEDGQIFERNLVQLQNTARRRAPWIVEITEDQVNGWFVSDLPEKFPESLPADIEDPRAVFTQDEIRIAFKYTVREFTGIVVISASTYCTEKPNEIALQLNSVKTGFIPLPIGPWLERVANSIRNAGIPVFWSQTSGTPIAIFTLPEHITTTATHHVNVEAIDLRPGKLVIAGTTNRTLDEEQKKRLEEAKARKAKQKQKRNSGR